MEEIQKDFGRSYFFNTKQPEWGKKINLHWNKIKKKTMLKKIKMGLS